MVAMHLGIALLMSLRVGLVFFTTLPTYLIGFRCASLPGSPEWLCAVCLGIGPSLAALLSQKLLPDQWPSSSISLFMWSGAQADALARHLMTGDTRIVMCTDAALAAAAARHRRRRGSRSGEADRAGGEDVEGDDAEGGKVKSGKLEEKIVGMAVLYHGGGAPELDGGIAMAGEPQLHDAVLRVIGFTIVQGHLLKVSFLSSVEGLFLVS
jgi:hypothetical protein